MTDVEASDLSTYSLRDRYDATRGRVFLSGIQALVRIPIEQLRMDRAAGRNVAAFVSGYPGSPLGGFDLEMARVRKGEPDLHLVHVPAVNEELGATAVMGSQLAGARRDLRVDGVVGVWYGKAPGLDRAKDALRHATFAGSSATGGAIALVGDDPANKSSTMPSSSDASLVDLHMPILYPGTVAECLELGLHGIAMSRATGLWSALKIVAPTADATETVELPVLSSAPVIPTLEVDGKPWRPHPSAQFLGARMLAVEQEFHEVRLELAHEYGRLNGLNQVTVDPPGAWLGCIATGYTYYELRSAFRRLGLADDGALADAGIRLLHLKMPVPFDERQIAHFAEGLEEILVVEEKYPTLEQLVRDALYPTPLRPRVVGKRDPQGRVLLPSHGLLDADGILPSLRARLEPRLGARLAPLQPKREMIPLVNARTPFFCSGCPHNWGTKVPEGAVVGMGTGCHGMTLLMDEARVGESIGITAMGNEGSQWIGMAPFVETDHVFQNLGDGTYFHSGQLSIQAAVSAGVNITFKLLYNSTVAMTGGQDPSHSVGVPELVNILRAHGVAGVAITAEDVDRYDDIVLPEGVKVHDRTEIVGVQEQLAAIPGVTVLIHDQRCAAELRRDRKRGRAKIPDFRVVINHRLCEGCGDCGDVSNCLSVQPVETPLGRKTTIDQGSCNYDTSCLKGDCPAFMTVAVDGDTAAPASYRDPATIDIPEPAADPERTEWVIRMAGIGGTGVVSAAQIVGTAAMLDGWDVDGLDQTGLSQKAGPVISDLTLTRRSEPDRAKLVGSGEADALIAFDALVAAAPNTIAASSPERTLTIASTAEVPTGSQVARPALAHLSPAELAARLKETTVAGGYTGVDAAAHAVALTGLAAAANLFLVGVAAQAGAIPVSVAHLRRAVELNGVAVEGNLRAFEWGRRWVAAPDQVQAAMATAGVDPVPVTASPLPSRLARRVDRMGAGAELDGVLRLLAADLVDYQSSAYAGRFLDLVEPAAAKERSVAGAPGAYTEAVARGFHKLLAYKDEYEVARLMLSPDAAPALAAAGGASAPVSWHLHPPALRERGMAKKLVFGSSSRPLFVALAKGKRVRGTRLDPFGHTDVRRLERELPMEYEAAIRKVTARLTAADLAAATELASLPEMVRGYEDLKLRRAAAYRDAFRGRLLRFEH